MNITLKNVKTHQEMSEETMCFSASIYLAGKRVGKVSNRGCGGCNEYQWKDIEAGAQIQVWAENQETEFEFEKLDQLIDGLRFEVEEKKLLTRWCKRKTLFALNGDEPGVFRTIEHAFTPEVKAFLHRKHGEKLARIVNEEL